MQGFQQETMRSPAVVSLLLLSLASMSLTSKALLILWALKSFLKLWASFGPPWLKTFGSFSRWELWELLWALEYLSWGLFWALESQEAQRWGEQREGFLEWRKRCINLLLCLYEAIIFMLYWWRVFVSHVHHEEQREGYIFFMISCVVIKTKGYYSNCMKEEHLNLHTVCVKSRGLCEKNGWGSTRAKCCHCKILFLPSFMPGVGLLTSPISIMCCNRALQDKEHVTGSSNFLPLWPFSWEPFYTMHYSLLFRSAPSATLLAHFSQFPASIRHFKDMLMNIRVLAGIESQY